METSNLNEGVEEKSPKDEQSGAGKRIVAVLLIVILLIGTAFGAWYYGSMQAEKEADAKIAELQSRIDNVEAEQTESTEEAKNELTEADVAAIDKALTQKCNGDDSGYEYTASKDGKIYTKVTRAFFIDPTNNDTPVYAKGFVSVSVGCKKTGAESAGGGYVSIMQRQTDGSWKQVIGTQNMLDCETVNKYKIPKEIQDKCNNKGDDPGASQSLVENTN